MAATSEDFFNDIIQTMKLHYGHAAQSYWVYADETCPGCRERAIDEFMLKGERAVSINGFMYREKSVLIAYFLCGACAQAIHAAAPVYQKTPLHGMIEERLKLAYHRHLASLNA